MVTETALCVITIAVLGPVLAVLVRLIYVLPALQSRSETKLNSSLSGHVMILLGSGGHTGEMIRLLSPVDLKSLTKTWLVSSGDTTSLEKAKSLEESKNCEPGKSNYRTLKRARKVGQPMASSVLTTLASIWSTFWEISHLSSYPDVLLINGPGTCVPVAYVLFLLKFLGLCRTRIIYIESLARVSGLSLSGKLVLPVSDRFIVQWEPLAKKYKRAEYYGILI